MVKVEVSIIILNYKQEYFLFELINHLTCYSFKIGIEFIIVDNNSMDEASKNFLEKKASSSKIPFTFLFFDHNFGPSYARNRAVDRAKGGYIQFIDADDWILPQKIELQYQFALKCGSPAFIASKWATVEYAATPSNYQIIEKKEPEFMVPEILSVIRPDGFTPLMSGIIKKDDYVKVGGLNEEMWLIEDVNFQIRLLLSEGVFINCPSPDPLFFYRKGHSNSLSQSNDYLFYKNAFTNAKLVQAALLERKHKFSKLELNVFSDIYSNIIRKAIEQKDLSWKQEIINTAEAINVKFTVKGGLGKQILFSLLGVTTYFKLIQAYARLKKQCIF